MEGSGTWVHAANDSVGSTVAKSTRGTAMPVSVKSASPGMALFCAVEMTATVLKDWS